MEATSLREKRKAVQKKEKPLKDAIKAFMKDNGLDEIHLLTGEKAETDRQDRWYYEKDLLMTGLKLTTEKQLRKFQRRQAVVSLKCHRE